MHVTLEPFRPCHAQALASLCQSADRTYLSGRLPSPYTLGDAEAFIRRVYGADHGQLYGWAAISADDAV